MQPDDLVQAKTILLNNGYTCVFCGNGTLSTDTRRGVRPLLDRLADNVSVSGCSVADKVVGKAAAFLYCLLGVKYLYAAVISEPALAVLQQAGIYTEYGLLVPAIRNRAGDGYCPMESAVWNITDPNAALAAIQDTLKKL